MKFPDFVASQFEVYIQNEGPRKGWVCFETPLGKCHVTRQDWEIVKNKINGVKL